MATPDARSLRTAPRAIAYRGEPFAPTAGTYSTASTHRLNLTTIADSGHAPRTTERLAQLGPVAPLALAALWEAGFALEAGPLSTWNN